MAKKKAKKRRLAWGVDYDGWVLKMYGSGKYTRRVFKTRRELMFHCPKLHYLDKAVKVKLVEVKP